MAFYIGYKPKISIFKKLKKQERQPLIITELIFGQVDIRRKEGKEKKKLEEGKDVIVTDINSTTVYNWSLSLYRAPLLCQPAAFSDVVSIIYIN